MNKLIILPGATNVLGGTLVTLSLLLSGITSQDAQASDRLRVLAPAGSFLEKYLRTNGHADYLQLITANSEPEFIKKSLQWTRQQSLDWALLMDNCVAKELMSVLVPGAISLRGSRRRVYFFFHDLALSYNPVGYLIRKLFFTVLAPSSMCNSRFTAGHIKQFVGDVRGILYQPVDFAKFNDAPLKQAPANLQAIIDTGRKIMLTPSRLNQPGIVNDKNLRALIPVLAALKQMGSNYHGVIIGEDTSSGGSHSRDLEAQAVQMGVADRFTILPPSLAIESYYKYADIVVTLAPREPFGRTIVEAISCGTPIVGSNSGGIGEILSHFAPEWTVEPEAPQAVAQTIAAVANSDHTAELLAAGQTWVKQNCSTVDYATRLLKITGVNASS